TYQLNILSLSVLEVDELLHQAREHLVEPVQVEAHDDTGGDHDRGGLPGLVAVGEVDLGQLAPHLADEPEDAADAAPASDRLSAGLALRLAGQRSGDASPPCRHLLLAIPACHRRAPSASPCAACAGRTSGSTC